ncbi:hypothetical protein P5V15_005648 [Pogonomyrmex californicus]
MSGRTRRRKEDEERKINNGEQDNFFTDEIREEMETMWEIPQIFHFLHLTKESLNIPQLSLYEMERMLLMPRASKQLANIMTCLLSSPTTKAKLRKVPPMPYEFWTNILAYKMSSWFKIYRAKHKDATKVLETIGVEPEFWNIFPETSLLEGKDFEDLSFKQRVWLLKTVCDTIMHTRKTVQEDMVNQPWEDQFETILGIDRNGAKYIYFPQFMPNDFRIYRHCLDNKILSTVRPVKPKQEIEMSKLVSMRLTRGRKRKLHNNLSDHRVNRCENRTDDKDLSNNDSAAGSFISEDTNLSSTSTCSNNNNICLDVIRRKRSRSLSKMSEESTLSNARSSGYDTYTSSDNRSADELEMFKGFANTQNDNCNIEIINEMLDDLTSEIDEEMRPEREYNDGEGNFVELYKNITISCSEALAAEKDERSSDNSSNSSKTDDEKLHEIINAENSKLPEDVYSKNILISDNISDISTLSSKSDDEKLSETKTSDSNINVSEKSLNRKTTFNEFSVSSCIDSAFNEQVAERQHFSDMEISSSIVETKSNKLVKKTNLTKEMNLRSPSTIKQCNKEDKIEMKMKEEIKEQGLENEIDETNEEDFFTSEMRSHENTEYDLDDYTNNSDNNYNLRSCKNPQTDEYKQHFDKMLSDLSISEFYLVTDSVEGLRGLIANLSNNDSNNMDIVPLCEVKLIKKLTDLLNSLESTETILKDAIRKAKAKLQREWSNFKDGSVEDQDSSSEGGLSSNWWVLGSQGRDPLSIPGDATLQTLPQPTLSPLGTQNTSKQPRQQVEGEHEIAAKSFKQSYCENRETSDKQRNENDQKQPDVEAPSGRNQIAEEGKKRQHKQDEENESAWNDEDAEQKTEHGSRRVLRARGISSYTEQLYSDDESNENELEEWADVEAVYAAPSTQNDTSAFHADPKERHAGDWSEEEDSDQDWILPSSRKRKNKRSSTNRKLKSFENKVQNIKENASSSQNNMASGASHPVNAKIKDKLKVKLKDNKIKEPEKINDSQSSGTNTIISTANNKKSEEAMPSTDAICNIESVSSVHSELDIKDENPSYESNPMINYDQNNYGPTNPQQNYYYMMPNSGIVQGVVAPPQVPQGYYIQPHMQPNYIMQTPPAPQQQQLVYQQQRPQMIVGQPYVSNANYASYMVATTQPQIEYMIAARPMISPQNPNPRPQNRYNSNNRYPTPRQSLQHPNGAVIRSGSIPIRSNGPRSANSKSVRGGSVSQRTPRTVPRQKVPQTPSIENSGQKTTSLIVLSDSDDEIEMIIMEKPSTTVTSTDKVRSSASRDDINQFKQKPTITSDITVPSTKGILPPQIIQRMSQGGISITPVKNNPPPQATNASTQLVVVVNETGSHYALALPNGSKLILTPEQVAQIRASNGGKLIL